MNIQAEKQLLMEQLAELHDIDVIKKIKEVLRLADIKTPQAPKKVITEDDLIARAEASEKAIQNGDIISIENLEQESKNW